MTSTAEFRTSWLVQRLRKPAKRSGPMGPDNPFAFGGGYKNGGLSDDAMTLLRGVFSFDYMGAAEFEFGAVPKALDKLAKNADSLTAFSVAIPLSTVPANWRQRDAPAPEGDAAVYVLCQHIHSNAVVGQVEAFATRDVRTKERVGLAEALRPFNEWDGEVCGWLELDNGFMFFTDREMWAAASALFGVEVPA